MLAFDTNNRITHDYSDDPVKKRRIKKERKANKRARAQRRKNR